MNAKKYTVFGIFWSHTKKYSWQTALILLTLVLFNACDIVVPLFMKAFFDTLAQPGSRQVVAQTLFLILGSLAGLYFLRFILRYLNDILGSTTIPRIMADLTRSSYERIIRSSYQFFSNNFAGSLVRKINRLTQSYNQIIDNISYSIVSLFVNCIGAVVILSWRSLTIGAAVAVWILLVAVANYWFSKYMSKLRLARAAKDSETTGALSDSITNAINVKQFNGYPTERSIITKVVDELCRLRVRIWFKQMNANNIQFGILLSLEVLVMYLAILAWRRNELTLGDFALIQGVVAQLWMVVWGVMSVFRQMSEALSDAQEMVDIMNMPLDVTDAPDAKTLKITAGAISFDKVGFTYNKERTVLDKFSLDIKPKEKIALVGSSGSGKSTIVKLLFRFYDVAEGRIAIDGQKIDTVTQESLRDAFAMVPQDPLLFHRSLMDNIRYGRRDATDEEVYEAAKKAHCHEFISSLPEGYGTFVGERGIKLSGGERQRVAIARAILKNAPILVLDEATSSLDSESEMMIQEALGELMREKSVIVIAHRLSTIAKMDRIIVMADGKIIDQGTHASLIKKRSGVYKKLWEIQAGGFIS